MPPLIQLEDIHRVYRVGEIDLPVLKGVSMSIDRSYRNASSKRSSFWRIAFCCRSTTAIRCCASSFIACHACSTRSFTSHRKPGVGCRRVSSVTKMIEHAAVSLKSAMKSFVTGGITVRTA